AAGADTMGFAVWSEKCDGDYEACMGRRSGKGREDCPASVLKCRNTCSPTWRQTSRNIAAPRSCRDKCQAGFDACVRADDGKHGGQCSRNVMVCREACPPEELPAGTAHGGAAAPGVAAGAPAAATAAAPDGGTAP